MLTNEIAHWADSDHLIDQIREALDCSRIAVIRNIDLTPDGFEEMLDHLGEVGVQTRNGDRILINGRGSTNWFDRREALPWHFDGVQGIITRGHMPLTALYAAEFENVIGGNTLFRRTADLYGAFRSDPNFRAQKWSETLVECQHETWSNPIRLSVLRKCPYMGDPYLLIDDRFATELIPDRFSLQAYRDGWEWVPMYSHEWAPRDLLIWSNESFVHARDQIERGTRIMYRGIVWNNHRRVG